jgi:hypothetical protein
MVGCKRCVALLVSVIKDGRQVEEWRIYNNPTIGEMRSLREKGGIGMFQVVERHGNQIDKTWVSDSGMPVVVSTEFLR